uniref:ATP synthase F0 subunit 8 n=1 Tax=Grandidierella taihuensis TaxID=2778875 RepID=UPI001BEDDCDA|nr:ATP synthase F0 subunit 8 [Grandidierella taihuensis]QTX95225.1 ATP synthase F0 subunit 8 [Grandidierella taihuensis]
MPQMAPTLWIFMLIMSSLAVFTILNILYLTTSPSSNQTTEALKVKMTNWKL